MNFAQLLAAFLAAVQNLQPVVSEVEAFVAKEASEAEADFSTLEAEAVAQLKAFLANPTVVALLADVKAVEAEVVAEVQALLAKV
jgi:hypothetical protein